MLDTQGFRSRKQLAAEQSVNTSTIWRWSKIGKVDKDTSTGVPLYRMAASSAAPLTPEKPMQHSVADPVSDGPRRPSKRASKPRSKTKSPASKSASSSAALKRQQTKRPPRDIDQAPPPERIIEVNSEGKPLDEQYLPIVAKLTDEQREKLLVGIAVTLILSGIAWLVAPIASIPARLPAHMRDKHKTNRSKSHHPKTRQKSKSIWAAPSPPAGRSKVAKAAASTILDITGAVGGLGKGFGKPYKAKPPKRRR